MRAEQERQYIEYVTLRAPALRRLARSLSGDWNTAEDILQETVITLYRRRHRVQAAHNTDQYVRKILVNAFLTDRRAWYRRVSLVPDLPDGAAPAFADADVAERDRVADALRQLPRGQRAAVVLRYGYDLPIAEVADALGCSLGTVKSQTSCGLAALRRLLNERPVGKVTRLPGRTLVDMRSTSEATSLAPSAAVPPAILRNQRCGGPGRASPLSFRCPVGR